MDIFKVAHSGSWARGAAGGSLSTVAALCFLSRTFLLRALLLPTLLLLPLLVLPAAAPLAADGRVERMEERDFWTKTFDLDGGDLAIQAGMGPLHYRDSASGELLDIDPTLVAEEGWRNETNAVPVRLPLVLGDGSWLALGPASDADPAAGPGVRWRPGPLTVRLASGLELEVASPAVALGAEAEDVPNSVLYADLYPGFDLRAEVLFGALQLELIQREWLLPFAPEQVELLFVEAEMDIAPELLEAVDERVAAGEPVEQVPLYFGRSGEEWVIEMYHDPGLHQGQIEEHASLLAPQDPDGPPVTVPVLPGWESALYQWLHTGQVRFAVQPTAEIRGDSVSTQPQALLASFRFQGREPVRSKLLYSIDQPEEPGFRASAETSVADFSSVRTHPGRLMAGKGNDVVYRALAAFNFRLLKSKLTSLGGQWSVSALSLGSPQVGLYVPPGGIAAADFEAIISSHMRRWATPSPFGGAQLAWSQFSNALLYPYSAMDWFVPNGPVTTGSWDQRANPQAPLLTVGNQLFFMAPMESRTPGSPVSRAVWDFHRHTGGFGLFLAMPYDFTPCVPCTDAHYDPAVTSLLGDYRVGVGFPDLRLEIQVTTKPLRTATLSATSVGGHNDRLYPDETLSWDLELTALAGGAPVALRATPWDVQDGVDFWFSDPANPSTPLPAPTLNAVGDRVRLNARWKRARPALYGQQKDIEVQVQLLNAQLSGATQLDVPVTLQAPQGNVTFQAIYPVVDNNISAPMGLAWVQLDSSGLRGASFAQGQLRAQSGPTSTLVRGTHWDLWSTASATSDGEVVIYPDQLAPGQYTVDLLPCLLPDGLPAPVSCGSAQPLSFTVRAVTPAKPEIDFVSPWSLSDPSGGTVTLSVYGSNLAGASAGTILSLPQVVSGASPAAGSTSTRVDVPVSLTGGTLCGPRTLTLSTAQGSANALVNITKPFAGNANHFVVEAEAGQRSNLKTQNQSGASGGQVVLIDTAGAPGELRVDFRVPASSSTYQIYGLYGTTQLNATRFDLEITEGANTVASYRVALPFVNPGATSLRAFSNASQPAPPTLLNLQAGKTYTLRLKTRTVQRYPVLDLLIFSDGTQPPTLTELCL
ncbi:MAG: hypothetical protein AAGD01_16330 [Acidobacteriota bacterium]